MPSVSTESATQTCLGPDVEPGGVPEGGEQTEHLTVDRGLVTVFSETPDPPFGKSLPVVRVPYPGNPDPGGRSRGCLLGLIVIMVLPQ